MTASPRPLRADARRNRETVLHAARQLLAERGTSVQMDEVAKRSQLGVGTVYRHFPTKQALIGAIVAERLRAVTVLIDQIDPRDPEVGFDAVLRAYLEAANDDVAFRVALLGQEHPDWDDIATEKKAFVQAVIPVLARAREAGVLPQRFDIDDFVLVTRGVMANMDGSPRWRRHLQLTSDGLRAQADPAGRDANR